MVFTSTGHTAFSPVGLTVAVELINQAAAVGWVAISKTLIGDASDTLPEGTMFPLIYSLAADSAPRHDGVTFADLTIEDVATRYAKLTTVYRAAAALNAAITWTKQLITHAT